MALSKQMEMFEDGGLKDEGGMTDEVSGNDVPSGSTREEVRDDIPAQLSEGEFVFPADVVRYIGLEKLMTIRQKAKQGLKQMEAMGQMGNSDEATMRDDLPFDINDLDMEDEVEYNRGGVVEAANGMYVTPNIPAQYRNESIETTNPMAMQQIQSGLSTGVNAPASYVPNMSNMYTPQAQAYAPANYRDLLGASADGAPTTESVRYVNEATGQTRMIPHLVNADGSRGDTLYPIPEGFVIQEEAPKEEAKKTTQVQSTKVKPVESGDNGDEDNVGTLGGARMDVGGREFALGYNFDGSITLTDPKTMESKTYDKDSQITKDAKAVTMGQIVELSKLTPAGIKTALVSSVADKLGVRVPGSTKIDDIKRKQQQAKNRLDKTTSGVGDDPSTGMSIEDMDTIQAGLEGKGTLTPDITTEIGTDDKSIISPEDNYVGSTGTLGGASSGQFESTSNNESYDSGQDQSYSDSGYSSSVDTGGFKQGGLAGKKKTPKPKKMKRGGLASR